MNKTLATLLLSIVLPSAACGTVESPDDMVDPDPEMMPPGDPDQPEPPMPKPQSGTVDTSYGVNGYLQLTEVPGYASHVALQGDKLVVCSSEVINGVSRAVLRRIGFDGAADLTFGLDAGRFEFGDKSYCAGLAVRADNKLAVFIKVTNGATGIFRFDADATTFDPIASGGTSRAMGLSSANQLLVAASPAGGQSSRDAEAPADIASIATLDGTPTRPFLINGQHAVAGVFTTNGQTGWGVIKEETEGALSMPAQIMSAGGPSIDFMHDAVALPDGTILAVGGADSDIDATVGRFPAAGGPAIEVRDIGLTSTFRRVVAEGQDKAVLFGTTYQDGAVQILWQRIDTATLTVDPSYAGSGTMMLPAFHGSGDISGVVRYNGALYALTTFDVEATAGAALLKINE